MSILSLILHEAWHRKAGSLLLLLAIVTAVALPVAFYTAGQASVRETSRLMRDLGYNLRIIPKDTDMTVFWDQGYSDKTMDGAGVQRFASRDDLSYNHLIAMLQRRVDWDGGPVILTGLATEVSPKGKKKSSMIFTVQPGDMCVGHAVAKRLGLREGESVEFGGQTFRIDKCLAESGSDEDLRAWIDLPTAQQLLDAPGRVNEIKALECHCKAPEVDTLAKLRTELESVLPDAQVLRLRDIATVRREQRNMAERYFAVVLPIVLLGAGLWIALLTVLNVRERREECGVLRALGHSKGRLVSLFLGKNALLGVAGGVVGFGLGTLVAITCGPLVFETPRGQAITHWALLPLSMILAPLFAMAAAFVPTALAATTDPADTLRGPG